MASGAAALNAVAAIAVFALLVISSEGHPKTGPLCSDCASQCSTNCTAITAANCSSYCGPPPGCQDCISVIQQNCCNNGTEASYSCCDNGCVGNCETCGCDCSSAVQSHCMFACKPNYSACQACTNAVGQQCNASCNSACNDNCVKKEKEC